MPIVGIVCVYLVLAFAAALTRLPVSDEGYYGVPAFTLATQGKLANSVLENAGTPLTGMDQLFYWMVPLGMVGQAVFFKIFGFGLFIQRFLSISWGLIALLATYRIVRDLVGSQPAAYAAALLAVDFYFLTLASVGRADMPALGIGLMGLSGYIRLRQRSLKWALGVANLACVLSGLTHPNTGISTLASLVVMTWSLDRRRLRWEHLAYAAAPYLAGILSWGAYIAQHPDLFVAQFGSNVGGRFQRTSIVFGEITRYVNGYGMNASGPRRLLGFLLLAYITSMITCAVHPKLRHQKPVRLLLECGIAVILSLWLIEGAKHTWYLVNISPWFCALTGIVVYNFRHKLIAAAFAGVLLLGISARLFLITHFDYQRLYLPAVAAVDTATSPGSTVFASSEFFFGMNCKRCLKDDARLGFDSGRSADVVVINADFQEIMSRFRRPEAIAHVKRVLSGPLRVIHQSAAYRVYARAENQKAQR